MELSQNLLALWGLIITLFPCVVASPARYSDECSVWRNVSRDVESRPKAIDVTCSVNGACTGIDCNGIYKFLDLQIMPIYEDVCFGVMVEPCKRPVSVFIYVIVPDTNTLYNGTFTNSAHSVEFLEHSETLYSINGYLALDMAHVNPPSSIYYPGYTFIQLDLKFQIVATSFGRTFVNDELPIVPGIIIPVPPCIPSVHNNVVAPSTCVKPTDVFTSTPTPKTEYGKTCEPDHWNVCPRYATCSRLTNTTGYCLCGPCYDWADVKKTTCVLKDDNCFAGSNTSVPFFYPGETSTDKGGLGTKKILMITFGTIGFLAVMGVLVGYFIIRYRRYQARYGQHVLLSNEEEDDPELPTSAVTPSVDDDEPPLDIST